MITKVIQLTAMGAMIFSLVVNSFASSETLQEERPHARAYIKNIDVYRGMEGLRLMIWMVGRASHDPVSIDIPPAEHTPVMSASHIGTLVELPIGIYEEMALRSLPDLGYTDALCAEISYEKNKYLNIKKDSPALRIELKARSYLLPHFSRDRWGDITVQSEWGPAVTPIFVNELDFEMVDPPIDSSTN